MDRTTAWNSTPRSRNEPTRGYSGCCLECCLHLTKPRTVVVNTERYPRIYNVLQNVQQKKRELSGGTKKKQEFVFIVEALLTLVSTAVPFWGQTTQI